MRHLRVVVLGLVLSGLGLSGCKDSSEPPPTPAPQAKATLPSAPAPAALRITAIELGKAVDAEKRVGQPTTTFSPGDTVYVSVVTDGTSPSATLSAKWTYDGTTLVKEDSQTIAPTGPAATEFHVDKPSGWPAGTYKVEISLNGSPVGAKEFEVKS